MALAVLQEMRLSGAMGDRLHAAVSQWLLPAPYANPGLFDVYVRRDNDPDPALSPRAGEYSGKYLISAILIFRMQREPRLRAAIEYSLFQNSLCRIDPIGRQKLSQGWNQVGGRHS